MPLQLALFKVFRNVVRWIVHASPLPSRRKDQKECPSNVSADAPDNP